MHKIGGINRIGLLIKEEGINWNKEEKKKPAKFKPKWKWLKKTDKAFQSLCLFRMQEKPKTKPYNIRSKGRETFENMAFVSFWLNALKGCRNFHCHMIIASFFLPKPFKCIMRNYSWVSALQLCHLMLIRRKRCV